MVGQGAGGVVRRKGAVLREGCEMSHAHAHAQACTHTLTKSTMATPPSSGIFGPINGLYPGWAPKHNRHRHRLSPRDLPSSAWLSEVWKRLSTCAEDLVSPSPSASQDVHLLGQLHR